MRPNRAPGTRPPRGGRDGTRKGPRRRRRAAAPGERAARGLPRRRPKGRCAAAVDHRGEPRTRKGPRLGPPQGDRTGEGQPTAGTRFATSLRWGQPTARAHQMRCAGISAEDRGAQAPELPQACKGDQARDARAGAAARPQGRGRVECPRHGARKGAVHARPAPTRKRGEAARGGGHPSDGGAEPSAKGRSGPPVRSSARRSRPARGRRARKGPGPTRRRKPPRGRSTGGAPKVPGEGAARRTRPARLPFSRAAARPSQAPSGRGASPRGAPAATPPGGGLLLALSAPRWARAAIGCRRAGRGTPEASRARP